MSGRGKLKLEEKVKIVIQYIAGEVSISGAAAKAGVDRKTLQRWVMQYKAEGAVHIATLACTGRFFCRERGSAPGVRVNP